MDKSCVRAGEWCGEEVLGMVRRTNSDSGRRQRDSYLINCQEKNGLIDRSSIGGGGIRVRFIQGGGGGWMCEGQSTRGEWYAQG